MLSPRRDRLTKKHRCGAARKASPSKIRIASPRAEKLSDQLEAWSKYCARDARNAERNATHQREIGNDDVDQIGIALQACLVKPDTAVHTAIMLLHQNSKISIAHASSLQMLEMLFASYRSLMLNKAAPAFNLAEQRGRPRIRRAFFDEVTFEQLLQCSFYKQYAMDVHSPLHRSLHRLHLALQQPMSKNSSQPDSRTICDMPPTQVVEAMLKLLVQRVRKCERQVTLLSQAHMLMRRENECSRNMQQCVDRMDLVIKKLHDTRHVLPFEPQVGSFETAASAWLGSWLITIREQSRERIKSKLESELQQFEEQLRSQREQYTDLEHAAHKRFEQASAVFVIETLESECRALLLDMRACLKLLAQPEPDSEQLHPDLVRHGNTLTVPRPNGGIQVHHTEVANAHADITPALMHLIKQLEAAHAQFLEAQRTQTGLLPEIDRKYAQEVRLANFHALQCDLLVLQLQVLEQLKPTANSETFLDTFTRRWREAPTQLLMQRKSQVSLEPQAAKQRLVQHVQHMRETFSNEIGPSRRKTMDLPNVWSRAIQSVQRLVQARESANQHISQLGCELETQLETSQEDFVLPRDWITRLPFQHKWIEMCQKSNTLPTFALLYTFLAQRLQQNLASYSCVKPREQRAAQLASRGYVAPCVCCLQRQPSHSKRKASKTSDEHDATRQKRQARQARAPNRAA